MLSAHQEEIVRKEETISEETTEEVEIAEAETEEVMTDATTTLGHAVTMTK